MRALPPAAAFAFACTAAAAGGETMRSVKVTATIANGCAVTSSPAGRWGDIALGTVDGATGGVAEGSLLSGGAAGIRIDCTPGMTATATADAGLQPQDGQRRLAGPAGSTPIPYALYADGSATPWTTQGVPLSFPVGTSRRTLPVRASASVAAPARAGTYTDVVRITLNW